MELNKFYNEKCEVTMEERLPESSIDIIITSPPYNYSKRKGGPGDSGKYDVYVDWKNEVEYIDWTIKIFHLYDVVLKEDRVVLYNFNYSIENPTLPYKLVSEIYNRTEFEIVDTIMWKKKTAMPHPASYNRLTRKFEYFFVFARKSERKTFRMSKKVVSIGKNGQKYYEVFDNIIEAKNNDGVCKLNRATYSSEVVEKMIDMYGSPGDIIYDNFMGTGSTAVAALRKKCYFIGSELSKEQCEYSEERIKQNFNIKL